MDERDFTARRHFRFMPPQGCTAMFQVSIYPDFVHYTVSGHTDTHENKVIELLTKAYSGEAI